MKVLFIIPDLDSGSGTCIKTVSNEMLSKGHDCHILTRYKVEIENQGEKVTGYFKSQRNNNRWVLSLKRILLYPIWPFFSFREFKNLIEETNKIVKKEKIDVVVSVYNPIESLFVGYIIKKKFPYVLFVAYFLDALLAGQRPRFMPEWIRRRKALRIENRLLSNADSVIMMKAVEPIYIQEKTNIRFFNKITFLDLPLYKPKNVPNNIVRHHFPDNQLVCFFAGALPRNIREPHYILNLFSKFNNIHFYIAGRGDFSELLNEYKTNHKNIHIIGQIKQNIITEMYHEADVLVNIGNRLNNMVPSKIFEYMSLGKPIINTVKIDNDPSIPYLSEYGNAMIVDERIDCNQYILQVQEFVKKAQQVNPQKNIFKLNQPSSFVDHITYLYHNA